MSFHNTRIVRAAKAHQCDLCNKEVVVGELHEYQAGVFEGNFYYSRLHKICASMITEYFRDCGHEDGWSPEYVNDWCHDKIVGEGFVPGNPIIDCKEMLEKRQA